MAKPYGSIDNIRELTGATSTDNIPDNVVTYERDFGDNMVEKQVFKEDIDHASLDFPLYQKAAELFASSGILRRFGPDRADEADTLWEQAIQICQSITGASETDVDTPGVSVFGTYTTYPLNPDGEYFGLRRRTGMSDTDPHHGTF